MENELKYMEEQFKSCIRNIPDFPKNGIIFRDITTLLKTPLYLKNMIEIFYNKYKNTKIDKVVSVESRGFILGSILAYKLNAGFVPVRKPKKLPSSTLREEYQLEYGTDVLEIHKDAVESGEHVLIVDDLLATGGTALATCRLVERLGGVIKGIAFLVELTFLNGKQKLSRYEIFSLVKYTSEE